ncbi:protein-glutamine gamma-glutamyltransferase 2-like, partial [Lampetra planeri]
MDTTLQTTHRCRGAACRLKLVNFEARDNHRYHETEGLSKTLLVVRRGKPFKVTLLFHGRLWNPHTESLVLEVCLGRLTERMVVHFSDRWSDLQCWSARIYPGNIHHLSVTVHICSPVCSSVAPYQLLVHLENQTDRRSYKAGTFVLLCNPWLMEDPVYMPLAAQTQEYIKSDYGLVYMGTHLNVSSRPWSYGQYEPGVLEACLKLLQVSPQHLSNQQRDYVLRADPVYLSRVVCAMVNSSDDMGVLEGRWQGSYKDGVRPTEWSSSADILHRWSSSNCSPVRYGQCWVFASVLCTVMRVLGIPSRVVTVFNAAHDSDGNVTAEEFYSTTGVKLGLSKDSIWNFHVWVECWMRRPDLGEGFDGWQVVDPTPQEKSAGTFRCGPCPVAAVQQRRLSARYDTSFIYASVDADIVRFIVSNGLVVERTTDTEWVGRLICTKSIGSDRPENLTESYKRRKIMCHASYSAPVSNNTGRVTGSSIALADGRLLVDISTSGDVFYSATAGAVLERCVLTLHHAIAPSEHELVLAGDDIVKVSVVIKDVRSKERVLATQDFNISSPQIVIKIEGGDRIQMNKEHTAHVYFTNTLSRTLRGAVLTVEGSGLLKGKHEERLALLQPDEKIEKRVSLTATSSGTKLLMATFSHSNSPSVMSRSFHK